MIGRSPQKDAREPTPLDEPQATPPRADSEPPPQPDLRPATEPDPAAPDSAAPSPGASTDAPPSIRAQIGATRNATKRLISAHVDLAKAEFGEIADEIKRVAILAAIAIGAAIVASLLVTVGLPLFLGEWIFGSIGWGLLHGVLFLSAIAIASIVSAVGVDPRAAVRGFAVGIVAGLVVGIVLGLNLTNRGWGLVGDSLLPLSDPGARPLAAALVVLPIVLGVLVALVSVIRASRGGGLSRGVRSPAVGERIPVGLPTAVFVGWLAAFLYAYSSRVAWPDLAIVGVGVGGFLVALVISIVIGGWRPGFVLTSGLAIGTLVGVILAGLSALGLGPRVGAAIGVTVWLVAWIATMGAEVARHGVDGEELKKRFIPQKTIDMTKETIEWARARMPLSRRS